MKVYRLDPVGTLDNLKLGDEEDRRPGPREVAIRIRATSLNYRDLKVATGTYGNNVIKPRPIPLSDGAGEVAEVGPGVTRVKVGDRVAAIFSQRWFAGRIDPAHGSLSLGGQMNGVLAERVVLSEEGIVSIPAHLSFEEAATLPCAALTAWHALFARMAGARVIVTSGSEEKIAQLKAMGITDVVNYRTTPDWERAVMDLTGGQGVDHVVELGGAGTFRKSLLALRVGGRLYAIGNLAGEAQIDPQMITQLISHKRRKAVMKQHPGGRVSRRSDTCKGTARKTGIVALVSLVAAATVALASNTALAQAYPVGPIRLVVPTTPGGGNDVIGRIIARTLSDGLGVQVVVDNRGGASGRIGAELVARAAPDGYTLLMGASSPLSTIPAVDPKLNYDPVKDFAPISLVALTEYTLVVHPSLPVKSIDDFIALARSKPGQVNFSSVGTGSSSHFTWELLKQLAKLDMLHVPYRGPGFAITAVLSGEVSSYLGAGPTLVPHVKAGRLVPLASTGPKRSKTFPDVPALNEVVPRCESTTWYGVLAPAGTPNTIITRLHDLIVKGMNVSATSQQIVASGANPASSSSPQQFALLIKAELAKWTKVVKASGITVE